MIKGFKQHINSQTEVKTLTIMCTLLGLFHSIHVKLRDYWIPLLLGRVPNPKPKHTTPIHRTMFTYGAPHDLHEDLALDFVSGCGILALCGQTILLHGMWQKKDWSSLQVLLVLTPRPCQMEC